MLARFRCNFLVAAVRTTTLRVRSGLDLSEHESVPNDISTVSGLGAWSKRGRNPDDGEDGVLPPVTECAQATTPIAVNTPMTMDADYVRLFFSSSNRIHFKSHKVVLQQCHRSEIASFQSPPENPAKVCSFVTLKRPSCGKVKTTQTQI